MKFSIGQQKTIFRHLNANKRIIENKYFVAFFVNIIILILDYLMGSILGTNTISVSQK